MIDPKKIARVGLVVEYEDGSRDFLMSNQIFGPVTVTPDYDREDFIDPFTGAAVRSTITSQDLTITLENVGEYMYVRHDGPAAEQTAIEAEARDLFRENK